jgi:hypothetical protein
VTLEVAEGSIRAIRLVVNPEKLGSVPPNVFSSMRTFYLPG